MDSDVAEQGPDITTAVLSSYSSFKFLNDYRLLTILETLPATTSECERVFSQLQQTLTSIYNDGADGESTI